MIAAQGRRLARPISSAICVKVRRSKTREAIRVENIADKTGDLFVFGHNQDCSTAQRTTSGCGDNTSRTEANLTIAASGGRR